MASNRHNKRTVSKDVQFSKAMTYLLRHGAIKEGFEITQDGFVKLDDILAHKNFKNATKEDLVKIVETCPKQRFGIKTVKDENTQVENIYIRANQGHSIDDLELGMKEITEADNIEECLHGTYYKAWEAIKMEGLSKMNRQHIHFTRHFPGSIKVISGMRSNCEVIVSIDISHCIKDGIKFFLSENDVILSPGDQNGSITPKYFKQVIDLKNNGYLDFKND